MAVVDSITKCCCVCQLLLPCENYWVSAEAKDGRNPRCKSCCAATRNAARTKSVDLCNAKHRRYYAENTASILASNARSRAKHDSKIKANKKVAYEKIKDNPDFKAKSLAYAASRKVEKRAYDRAYRERRADHLRSMKSVWNADNASLIKTVKSAYKARRREQEDGGDTTAVLHKWEMAAPKVCHWCSVKCPKKYHVDHYQPLSKGGAHTVANLVIACPKCNLTKSAKDPYEFATSLGRLF